MRATTLWSHLPSPSKNFRKIFEKKIKNFEKFSEKKVKEKYFVKSSKNRLETILWPLCVTLFFSGSNPKIAWHYWGPLRQFTSDYIISIYIRYGVIIYTPTEFQFTWFQFTSETEFQFTWFTSKNVTEFQFIRYGISIYIRYTEFQFTYDTEFQFTFDADVNWNFWL